ncbi:hypothetical protein ABOM_012135 [Aspergillus bombycis]|uniref:Uncharacterized protein n=1 Tax=Aspergillus bombycis TaxID=109264 RepID=A0A1F7ZJB6_9EURO|nr:hypothetical protein ABOM_012135 [Aspergillus bombycis]OGM39399.1 hypothetical protein ABOM_012135 [Aspergillus bombycis]
MAHRQQSCDLGELNERYLEMLVEVDNMWWVYNVAASAAHWVLLAGYLVVPGTFTSLEKSDEVKATLEGNRAGEAILGTIQNPPLLVISCLSFAAGVLLFIWLGWEMRYNYIWLVSRIFMPAAMNAAAGLLTTMVNIYTARGGDWSVMALATTIVTGVTLTTSGALVMIYKLIKLATLKEAPIPAPCLDLPPPADERHGPAPSLEKG